MTRRLVCLLRGHVWRRRRGVWGDTSGNHWTLDQCDRCGGLRRTFERRTCR